MSERNAVEIRGLSRSYGDSPALSEITLDIPVGATVAIFGPNGSGKSTLLRVLATLLQPEAGSVSVLEHEIPNQAFALRGKIGLLAHEPMLYRHLTARENLNYLAQIYDVTPTRVDELLESVELTLRADDPLNELSKGMVQRVALCRCVMHEPELLLLDEPFANLDPAGAEIAERMIGSHRDRTRLIASHDLRHELASADYVLGLKAGKLVFFGTTAEIPSTKIEELYQ